MYIYIYIYKNIYKNNIYNNFIVKQQTFAIDRGYHWYLNICIYNLWSCYETSRQNKKEENLDVKSFNITVSFVKVHVIAK